MGASDWADSRTPAKDLKTGAIKLRENLLEEQIHLGMLRPVFRQCKIFYLALCTISESPSAKDVKDPNGILKTMTDVVLKFHKSLWQLIEISEQLDSGNVADTDQATVRRQRTEILDEVLRAISMYIQMLPDFLELADSQSVTRQGSVPPHGQQSRGESPSREDIA